MISAPKKKPREPASACHDNTKPWLLALPVGVGHPATVADEANERWSTADAARPIDHQ